MINPSIKMLCMAVIVAPLAGCLDVSPRGVVHEIRSQQPVADATVELECRKYELHGTSLIRVLTGTSDSHGEYRFGMADVIDCDVVLPHVSKQGYVDAALIRDSLIPVPFVESGRVPRHVYLAKAGDAVRLQIEGLFQQANAPVSSSSEAATRSLAYEFFAKSMTQSRRIATSAQDIAWVRSHYCSPLAQRWAALAPPERAQANRPSDVDSQETLSAYCGGAEPSAPASAPPA